jgi:hypothetical protein
MTYIPTIITVASVVSAVLPAPRPGSFGALLVGLINLVAVNVGHAANATPANLKTETNNTSTTP